MYVRASLLWPYLSPFSKVPFMTSCSEFQLPGEKLLCLAKFFLGIGVPGNPKDLFLQLDTLAHLESNRQAIDMI